MDSDADTLVAVRRKDVSLDSAEGRKMAFLDNLTTQVNLTWDETELETVQADVEGFDVADFGFELPDDNIDDFFQEIEETTDGYKGFVIKIGCGSDLSDKKDEMIRIISEALKDFKGIKIK